MFLYRCVAGVHENVHESVLGRFSHVLFSHVVFLAQIANCGGQHKSQVARNHAGGILPSKQKTAFQATRGFTKHFPCAEKTMEKDPFVKVGFYAKNPAICREISSAIPKMFLGPKQASNGRGSSEGVLGPLIEDQKVFPKKVGKRSTFLRVPCLAATHFHKRKIHPTKSTQHIKS